MALEPILLCEATQKTAFLEALGAANNWEEEVPDASIEDDVARAAAPKIPNPVSLAQHGADFLVDWANNRARAQTQSAGRAQGIESADALLSAASITASA